MFPPLTIRRSTAERTLLKREHLFANETQRGEREIMLNKPQFTGSFIRSWRTRISVAHAATSGVCECVVKFVWQLF